MTNVSDRSVTTAPSLYVRAVHEGLLGLAYQADLHQLQQSQRQCRYRTSDTAVKEDLIWPNEFLTADALSDTLREWAYFYNQDYSHSMLGYASPCEYEQRAA